MEKRNLAFGRMNYLLLAISVLVIIVGLVMMSGDGSTEEMYNPEIFSALHIKVAPVVTFLGFISIIVAIMWKPSDKEAK